jgi:hypothetical protein
MIDTLQAKFGDGLVGEIQKNGLKAVAEKAGIDISNLNLPDMDFSHLMDMKDQAMGVAADMFGKADTDGDGKTGLAEVADTAQALADKVGLGNVLDKAKDVVAEARGVDINGDGKSGITGAVGQAKETLADVQDTVMNSAVGGKVADLAGNAKDAVMNTEAGAKIASAAEGVTGQAGGFLGKIKSFFGV